MHATFQLHSLSGPTALSHTSFKIEVLPPLLMFPLCPVGETCFKLHFPSCLLQACHRGALVWTCSLWVSVDYLSRLPAHVVCNKHTVLSIERSATSFLILYIFIFMSSSLQEFQLHVSLLRCECPSLAWSYKLWMTSSLPRSCIMDLLRAPTNTHGYTQGHTSTLRHTVTHTQRKPSRHTNFWTTSWFTGSRGEGAAAKGLYILGSLCSLLGPPKH